MSNTWNGVGNVYRNATSAYIVGRVRIPGVREEFDQETKID